MIAFSGLMRYNKKQMSVKAIAQNSPVTLSEAKGLHHSIMKILRYAQNDG